MSLANFYSKFSKLSASNTLPLDDSEKALDSWCAIPVGDGRASGKPRISNSSFKHIATILENYESRKGLAGWSYRPRIYTVLRNIDQVDAMQMFIRHGLMDFSLPFALETLPQELGESRVKFIEYQEYVLTEARELEKGIDGKHVHFAKEGGEHFYVHRLLGSGAFGRRMQHRDIKPENILIKNGSVYVADFGTAHDWSKKEQSTTWSSAPRTPRYMAPEIAKDPHAPKNSSTDMWSLGVVFLEMITVLRGQSIRNFRQHLRSHGTAHQFVYANAPATYSWFEILRQSDAGPDYDNEPLTWIKDMIGADPINRPTARALARQILESTSSEQFCGFCCGDSGDSWEDPFLTSANDVPHDVTVMEDDDHWDRGMADIDDTPINAAIPESSSHSIQAWLGLGDSFTPSLRDHALGPSSTTFSKVPYEIEADEPTEIPITMSALLPDRIPERLSNFDVLADQGHRTLAEPIRRDGEEAESDNLAYEVISDGSDSDNSELTIKPFDTSPSLVAEDDLEDESRASPSPSSKSWMWQPLRKDAQSRLSHPEKTQDRTAFAVPPKEIMQSGGHEKAQNTAASALYHADPLQCAATPKSHHSHRDCRNVPVEGKLASAPRTPLMDSSDVVSKAPKVKVSQNTPNHTNHNQANSEALGVDNFLGLDLSKKSPQGPARVKPERPSITFYRPVVTAPLTSENLERLEPGTKDKAKSTTKGVPRPIPRISAKAYMQDIWKAESSAATSVISDRSKARFGANISWQDRTYNYLGYYAQQGQAATVRHLLEMKCNPGTQAKPRPGPLLNAVRGGSERHTKCVRALLDYGADVNIRSSKTGETPLHVAVAHRNFKGYGNLVYALLDGGADPNVKDNSGDVPLLQILYGGYEPLEKHKRDALALLLEQTRYATDVNIMPPGTLNMPLHLAVRRKDPWAVGMLLEKGAKVDEPNGAGATPFALATSSWNPSMTDNQKEVAELLLWHDARVNEKIGSAASTALHIAIIHGRKDVVELLLQYVADPEVVDKEKHSAFDIARLSVKNHKITPKVHGAIMHVLFQAIGVAVPIQEKVCAIVTAVVNSDTKAAKLLLERGADPNHRIRPKNRPSIHLAIMNGDLDMVKLLMKRGASIHLKDQDDCDALQCAKQAKKKVIEDYLMKHSEKTN
ncbi:MAG: hypothetical protein M1830_007500 [Pleopsidium flavum]|nr:MAG: hypothetical protein M1830_007500 [Pleopsidium flavum]